MIEIAIGSRQAVMSKTEAFHPPGVISNEALSGRCQGPQTALQTVEPLPFAQVTVIAPFQYPGRRTSIRLALLDCPDTPLIPLLKRIHAIRQPHSAPPNAAHSGSSTAVSPPKSPSSQIRSMAQVLQARYSASVQPSSQLL